MPTQKKSALLLFAAQKNDLNMMQNLLLFPYKNIINCSDVKGKTPLHYAVIHNNYEMGKFLLKEKADPNYNPNNEKEPSFIKAVKSGYFETVKLFLEYEADIDQQTKEGYTALHYAINYLKFFKSAQDSYDNYCKIIDLLLQWHPNLSLYTKLEKYTPLLLAVEDGLFDIVHKLITLSDKTINQQDHEGNTPLHIAISQKRPDIVKFLIEWRANVNIQEIEGLTPLHYAIYYMTLFKDSNHCYNQIIDIILAQNPDLSLCTYKSKMTPFLFAAKKNCFEAIQKLLDYINKQSKNA